ncbi:MAG: transglutaminase domain-containing protein [Oscillospiraceae bacterium]
MKKLRFEYETKLKLSQCATDHSFTLRCTPFSDGRQTIAETFCKISPEPNAVWHSRDSFGNMLVCGRMDEPHMEFSFKVNGEAHIINSYEAVGAAAPFYRFHTSLTLPGKSILSFYEKNKPTSSDILSRSKELSSNLYDYMTYLRGVTGTDTTAEQAMEIKNGVCQDYTHILLSLLRLEKIPCRYVSGLAFQSGETHAWAEVHDGTRWIGIDPTHNCLIGDRYIKLCHGRDYSDCPIERGIYLGNAESVQTIYSCITEI